MGENRTCERCDRPVRDKHLICEVCRGRLTDSHGGGDDDGPSPGLQQETTEEPETPPMLGPHEYPVIA